MKRRRLLALGRYLIGALLIYWLSKSGMVDWQDIRDRLRTWHFLLLPFALLLASLGTMSWRLLELLRGGGLTIGPGDAFRISVVGTVFNLVLPAGGGDAARFWYTAADAAGKRIEIAAILLLDRLVGMLTLLMLPLIALPFVWARMRQSTLLTSVVLAATITALGVVIALALVIAPRGGAAGLLQRLLQRMPFQAYLMRFVTSLRGYREHPGALARASLASFATHVLIAAAISALYLDATHSPGLLVGVVSLLGFVANSLPLTPGGLGVGETAFAVLYREAGLSGGAAALLSWRVLLLTLAPLAVILHLRGYRVALATTPR